MLEKSQGGGTQGFTLIEMLVVIGIIAIVTVSALPSLRGLYRDFKIRQTIEETDTFITGLRSYYLIMNEFPPDPNRGHISTEVLWCLPKNYCDTNGNFLVKPYQVKSDGAYDFDNVLASGLMRFTLRSVDTSTFTYCKPKWDNLYPGISLPQVSNGATEYCIPFPEFSGGINQYR